MSNRTTLKNYIEERKLSTFSTAVQKVNVATQLKELRAYLRGRNFQKLYEVAVALADRVQRERLGAETTYEVLEALFVLKRANYDVETYIEKLLHI
jgi:aspartate carbamoyltransferase catalytic subunit